MSALLSEAFDTVLTTHVFFLLEQQLIVALAHHFLLRHLVKQKQKQNLEGSLLFFSLYVMFFLYLALRIHFLSLKFNIIRLCPCINGFLLLFPRIQQPLQFTHSGPYFTDTVCYYISLWTPFQFHLSDRVCQGYRSSLHWFVVLVHPPRLLLYI